MVRLRTSVGYMVLMIAGAVAVEGALVALPSLVRTTPAQPAPVTTADHYFVEVRDPGEGRMSVEMRPSS